MMHEVILTDSALADLDEIFAYVGGHDSMEAAKYVINSILDLCDTLTELPSRGASSIELQRLGVLNYREVFFKSYRVLYAIGEAGRFEVLLIADGRRVMQALLIRRLFNQ